MSIVVARGLSFEFPNGRELFQNLNLSLDASLTALVGPNGVGKTYLARVLAGEALPKDGEVRRSGSIKLVQQRELPPDVSVAEYLMEHEWSYLSERLLRPVDLAAPCNTLSGGQWMRVRLARALSADFLILDEPTNDLDREGRETILEFLRTSRHGILLISHDRECLELCNDILELSSRGLTKFSGGWTGYREAKAQEQARLDAALLRAKRERDQLIAHRAEQLERQEKRSRRAAKAAERGGMPKILLGARKRRAQSTTSRLDATLLHKAQTAVTAAHEALGETKVDPLMYVSVVGERVPSQRLVAEARDFNIRFADWLYPADLNFSWRGNVRVALRGANGSGKSTLLKALMGERLLTRGEWRSGDLVTLYLDQSRSALDDRVSVLDNIRVVSSSSDTEIRNQLARFLFARDAVFQRAGELSGGERMRAALARGLLATAAPELLLLDEPTNNLDLANTEFLANIVRDFQGAVIVVSHDDRFLGDCEIDDELIVDDIQRA